MATLGKLLSRLRSDLDDEAEPRLWSDAELVEYVNRAVDEACLRTKLILDSDTPEVCQIRLIPGKASYPIHRSIMGIRRARIPGHDPLRLVIAETLDDEWPNWQDQEAERPVDMICNLDSCTIRVHPTPTVLNTVHLTVWRTALQELDVDRLNEEPQVARVHHYNLLEWAKHLAYSKHDGDAHDPQAAATHAAYFSEFFGPRRNAQTQAILFRTPNLKVRPHFN